jgi:hypothetical protein
MTGVTTVTFPTSGTLATTSNKLNAFAATTSAELAGVISDETGSGALVFANTPTLTTPNIGAATGTSLAVTGNLTTSGGVIGYATGSGGTVTQITDKSTAVTLNKPTGVITTTNAALAAGATVSFTLNNSFIASATDYILCDHVSGGTALGYTVKARATGAGAATVYIKNTTAGPLSEALGLRFAILRAVSA